MFTRRSDDELVSAYIDGQLDERSRRALETRMQNDPALRRRVDATRSLVQAAREMPQVTVPRNFTLPRGMGMPARKPRTAVSATGWRLGSAIAAAIFVLSIGLDVSGVMAPQASLPASEPRAAKSLPPTDEAGNATGAGASESERVAPDVAQVPTSEAGSAATANEPPATQGTPEPTPEMGIQAAAPLTASESLSIAAVAAPTATAPQVESSQRLSQTAMLTQAYGITQAQGAQDMATTSLPEAPAATAPTVNETSEAVAQPPATAVVPNEPVPASTWLRLAAALAFVMAVAFAVIGWHR